MIDFILYRVRALGKTYIDLNTDLDDDYDYCYYISHNTSIIGD